MPQSVVLIIYSYFGEQFTPLEIIIEDKEM